MNASRFQSTLPRGSDINAAEAKAAALDISIHAPSRERRPLVSTWPTKFIFQSTLPRGSDKRFSPPSTGARLFQSTLPRGSDTTHFPMLQARKNFNPRSLAGATCSIRESINSVSISIHAPSRERHHILRIQNLILRISIHAPSRERHDKNTFRLNSHKFQSTLPRGSDASTLFDKTISPNFNPRSLAGATQIERRQYARNQDFNPRSLAGATVCVLVLVMLVLISIHAPSRERRSYMRKISS